MGRRIDGLTEQNDNATLLFFFLEIYKRGVIERRCFDATSMTEGGFITSSSNVTCFWKHLSLRTL